MIEDFENSFEFSYILQLFLQKVTKNLVYIHLRDLDKSHSSSDSS